MVTGTLAILSPFTLEESSSVSHPQASTSAPSCAHVTLASEAPSPEMPELVSDSDTSVDGEESQAELAHRLYQELTRMHPAQPDKSTTTFPEERHGAVRVVKEQRQSLLKPTLIVPEKKIEIQPSVKSRVRFTRDPSPKPTSSRRMLSKERLLDVDASLCPTLGSVNLATASNTAVEKKEALLPPTYFAAYVVPKATSPFSEEYAAKSKRVVGHVDTGATPWSVVSQSFVNSNNLLTSSASVILGLGDKSAAPVATDKITDFNLRVTIGDRARIIHLKAAVWDDSRCTCPLLISRADALRTGLIIFVHDNDIREALLGIAPLKFHPEGDSLQVVGRVATIISAEEDQDLLERISPLEGFRAALEPASKSEDPWVKEFLESGIGGVFGPIPKEPANVPYLDFDVDEELVNKRTFGNTQPIRMALAAPRKQDSIDAHVAELQSYSAIALAYPEITPQPIASVAFVVPKQGAQFVARPADLHQRIRHPLDQKLLNLHADYLKSLTSDRLVVNFKPVNDVSRIQHYPVPTVQENLQKLSRFKYFSKIDITKAFWSVGVKKKCQRWLYTIAPGGHAFVWTRAPMGHSAVPGHFQFCVNGVLLPFKEFAFAFADDIIAGGNTVEELKRNVAAVLKALFEVGFRVNAKKCQLYPQEEVNYLGWIVGKGQLRATENTLEKLYCVRRPCDMPHASDKEKRTAVKRFLGVCLYLGAYLPNASVNLRPLHQATRANKSFKWTPDAEKAWEWAVSFLKEIKPLNFPTYAEGSWLETLADASKTGWGGLLVEFRKGDDKPYLIMCVAGTFSPAQINWPTIQKECLASWMTVRKARCYLDGHEFILNMDHKNLLWSSMSSNEVVRRLATDLQQFRFVMQHIDGERNTLADYLSRAEHISRAEFDRMRQVKEQERKEEADAAKPRTSNRSPTTAPPSLTSSTCATYHASENLDGADGAWEGATSMPPSSDDRISCSSPVEEDSSQECMVDPKSLLHEKFSTKGVVKPLRGLDSHVLPAQEIQAQDLEEPLNNPEHHDLQSQESQGRRRRAPRRSQVQIRQVPRAFLEGYDDGLPIPFLEEHPNPPKRFLSPEVYHLLHAFHGGACPHTGVQPLIQALREAGHDWDTLDEDCRSFVARCHLCQLERLNRRGPQCLPYRSVLIPSRLFEAWSFDIIGPLTRCGWTGSTYVYIGVEETSHLCVLDHSVEASTPELLLFLLNTFKFFGLPSIIKSDVGAQFISKTLSDFCKASGIEHRFGVPHNHRSDGTVENSIKMVWSYLRLAIHDLKRYASWSPLLMNVMLGCNSLPREVLGGASASALVFNRKVQPMRFLRPDTLGAPYNQEDPGPSDAPVQVNGFIADQAAQQLRLLYFAEQTRQERYGQQVEEAERQRQEQEENRQNQLLDWVRVGQLVSIPQEEHENQLRPGKMSLRRTGPYEVMECTNTTVSLRDRRAFMARENPATFLWPKREVWPYFARAEPAGEVQPLPQDNAGEARLARIERVANAIIATRMIEPSPTAPQTNVRNREYLVRWEGLPRAQSHVVPVAARRGNRPRPCRWRIPIPI
jgi:hypothetical protein